jgi:DNA (cytosine-5)-methyltransferase 1
MSGLILSLFPGIGMLDLAFELEGFCVVRGPDLLWGGDIHKFHPPAGRFDGVIGGPPCQAFSRLRHMVEANGYELAPNLIPEFERVVSEAQPEWFLMENVPAAPMPRIRPYAMMSRLVTDVHVGGETSRVRRFTFGHEPSTMAAERFHVVGPALHPTDCEPAVTSSAAPVPVKGLKGGGRKSTAGKPRRSFAESCRLQGLPEDFDLPPFTATAKQLAVGNGVPIAMGRAVARAVKAAMNREAA